MFVPSVPSCLCFFPPSHPFLQGLRFLNQVSIYLMSSLFIHFLSCFNPVIPFEDAKEVSSSSFFVIIFFPGGVNSSFGVNQIASFCFTCFPMWQFLIQVLLNHSRLSIRIRNVEDISEDSCFHS